MAKDHHHQDNRCAHEVMYVVGIVLVAGILTLLPGKRRLVHREEYPDRN